MVAAFDDVQRRGLAKFLDDGTQQIEPGEIIARPLKE